MSAKSRSSETINLRVRMELHDRIRWQAEHLDIPFAEIVRLLLEFGLTHGEFIVEEIVVKKPILQRLSLK